MAMSIQTDILYMGRALELARHGLGNASPNPMVGAVIVHDGRIIGEGYHRRCGEGHAEVNAVNAVADKTLLRESTIYVTLEPCAHYGKTPPCARLLVECGFRRVVVGCLDPFAKVCGRGIAMLRHGGIDVTVGVLEDECRRLNRRFFTAHTLHRPFMTLKWAQSADGFMDADRGEGGGAFRFSNGLTTMLTHRLRSLNDAILTTAATVRADNPRMTVRSWCGNEPYKVVLDRSYSLVCDYAIMSDDKLIISHDDLADTLTTLYRRNITSCLVEAGPRLLQSCIDGGFCDRVIVETAQVTLGQRGRHRAPVPPGVPVSVGRYDGNLRIVYDVAGLQDEVADQALLTDAK